MELDDLKQAWQQQTPEDIDVRNNKKITDMIQHKSYGPLASLKTRYERVFLLVALIYGWLAVDFISTPGKWQHFLHNDSLIVPVWVLLLIVVVSMIMQVWNYVLIRKMQNMQAPIKSELERNISFIDNNLKIQKIVGIIMFAFICGTIEMMTHHHKNDSMKDWYNVSIYLRILAYIAYIALGYFISKYSYQRQFGKHIDYLKDMLRKME